VGVHEEWVRQIAAEIDGELTLPERAALAHHLAGCTACAGARASHLELRAALARSAGQPDAQAVPRSQIRGRSVVFWVAISLLVGITAGWLAHVRWGGPGPGSLEASRAAFTLE
jgi:anti-sigma factor RsiW